MAILFLYILSTIQHHAALLVFTIIAYNIITEKQPPLDIPKKQAALVRRRPVTFDLPPEIRQETQRPLLELALRQCPVTKRLTMYRASTSNIPRVGKMIRSDPGPSPRHSVALYSIPERSLSFSYDVHDDDENMTLAQRRDVIKRKQVMLRRLLYETAPSSTRMSSSGSVPTHIDTPDPKKNSSTYDRVESELRFARWRESLTLVQTPQLQLAATDEAMGTAMVEDRQKARLLIERKGREETARAQVMEVRMRSKAMLESHRKAMRQMQARVAAV